MHGPWAWAVPEERAVVVWRARTPPLLGVGAARPLPSCVMLNQFATAIPSGCFSVTSFSCFAGAEMVVWIFDVVSSAEVAIRTLA